MLDQITPVILTYNEEANLSRTLDKLGWAKDIVVLDSVSTDATPEIAQRYPQVRFFQRKFDTHSAQWNYATKLTGIATVWVLALDADYVLTDEFIEELTSLDPSAAPDGYRANFRFCIWGKPLHGAIYPPAIVLYRNNKAFYSQNGHTQRVQIHGPIAHLRSPILHDDRKPLSRWLASQDRYSALEVEHLARQSWSQLSSSNKLRRFPLIAPFVIFIITYFAKGTILDGRAGLYYSIQRLVAEFIIALRYLERKAP